jgi:hypothetical protein
MMWTASWRFFYSLETDSEEYVFHPINAFHMMQRTATWLPKLKRLLPDLEFAFNFPSVTDATSGAAHGLSDILEYHNLDALW